MIEITLTCSLCINYKLIRVAFSYELDSNIIHFMKQLPFLLLQTLCSRTMDNNKADIVGLFARGKHNVLQNPVEDPIMSGRPQGVWVTATVIVKRALLTGYSPLSSAGAASKAASNKTTRIRISGRLLFYRPYSNSIVSQTTARYLLLLIANLWLYRPVPYHCQPFRV